METKYQKLKINKVPQTALAFYIKLYCKRKASSKTKYDNNLIEATKSWLSLTEEEKQHIHKKYKQCEEKYKLQCFNQLKNAELFLKVKDSRLDNCVLNNSNLVNQESEDDYRDTRSLGQVEEVARIENNEMTANNDAEIVPNIDFPIQDLDDQNEIISEPKDKNTPRTVLVEPLPPTLRTGKDLYHMLNSKDHSGTVTWRSLPQTERNQYSRAVFLLKKDYITKYKEYLENLTPKELFDYYNKTMF